MSSVAELVSNFQSEQVEEIVASVESPAPKPKRIRVSLPARLVMTGTSYMGEKPDHKACWSGYAVLHGSAFLIRFFGEDADVLMATVGAGRVENEPNPDMPIGTRVCFQVHEGASGLLYEGSEISPEFLALDHAACLTGRFYSEVPVRQEMVAERF